MVRLLQLRGIKTEKYKGIVPAVSSNPVNPVYTVRTTLRVRVERFS